MFHAKLISNSDTSLEFQIDPSIENTRKLLSDPATSPDWPYYPEKLVRAVLGAFQTIGSIPEQVDINTCKLSLIFPPPNYPTGPRVYGLQIGPGTYHLRYGRFPGISYMELKANQVACTISTIEPTEGEQITYLFEIQTDGSLLCISTKIDSTS